MEWNRNFCIEYGRCQNGMEDFNNGMEDNLVTNSLLDFVTGIYKKYISRCRLVINNILREAFNICRRPCGPFAVIQALLS